MIELSGVHLHITVCASATLTSRRAPGKVQRVSRRVLGKARKVADFSNPWCLGMVSLLVFVTGGDVMWAAQPRTPRESQGEKRGALNLNRLYWSTRHMV